MPIINYQEKADEMLSGLLNDSDIDRGTKDAYKRYLESKERKPATLQIEAYHLRHLFKALNVPKTLENRNAVNQAFSTLRNTLSPGYLEKMKASGIGFVRWLNDGITPKGWRDIHRSEKAMQRKLHPDDMLTWQDGEMIADATHSVMWSAFLLTQLDCGMRPSELLDLNFGDIEFREQLAIVKVRDGKTGARDVIALKCVPALQRWHRMHPLKKKNSPLWLTERGKNRDQRLTYFACNQKLRMLKEVTGITKPIDIYSLRHSAVYLSKMEGTPTDLACRRFGHSVKHYVQTYGRLSTEDDVKRFKQHHKLAKDEEKTNAPIKCMRCATVNESGLLECSQCGSPLTLTAALEKTQEMDTVKAQLKALEEQMSQLIAATTSKQAIIAEKQRRPQK